MKKGMMALAGAAMAGTLVFTVAAPAQAATYTRYSYCTGLNSSVDVRTNTRTGITVNAYSLRNGSYLGSRTGTGTRLFWAPGWRYGAGEDVKFVVSTGVAAKSISTSCGLSSTWFVTG